MIYRGRELQRLDGYTTDLFTDEALGFMNRNTTKPWFLYLAYNAVHTPLEVAEKFRNRIPSSVTDANRRGYLSLLLGLDDAIGRIHTELKAKHPNTLVFFFSDNGGSGRKPIFAYNTGINTPLRGDKGQTLEGGIRVPFFMSWPGQLPPGKTYDQPVSAMDVLPTALAADTTSSPSRQTNLATIEGVNLLPYLKGEKSGAPHDMLAWRFGPQKAIRRGNWKLVDFRDLAAKTQSGWQLYDLDTDIGETKNLAADKPELVAELSNAWDKWNTGNVPPLWHGTPLEDPTSPAPQPGSGKKAK
jgi:arylsulfatase A-like enzyme